MLGGGGEELNVYAFQVTTRREEERGGRELLPQSAVTTDRSAMAANATTEAPFRIPELTAEEVRASAACMEERELFTYVLCSLATLAGALVLTLIPRLLIAPCKRRRREAEEADRSGGVALFVMALGRCYCSQILSRLALKGFTSAPTCTVM